MPILEGASNFTIGGSARLYELHGNTVINNVADANELKKIQSIANLPRAQASQKDYETRKKSGPCFPGTREALLREIMGWTNESGESRMYVLSGLAGIGKSTVAYTVATQADELGLLGASFFFSRDEDDRNNAKRFFTTIAYQLCLYDETFANAIGDVLLTKYGFAAATQNPQEQLQTLILDPLRSIIRSRSQPILIVVDALDECDEEDALSVLTGLSQLVRDLTSFKVILTTRPLDLVLGSQDDRRIFHLQDIEDKVVDSDVRLYLQHCLSLEEVQKRYRRRQWCASDEEIDSLVRAVGRLFIIASTAVRYIFDRSTSNPAARMQKLLLAFAQHVTPFNDLDHFYTVILRNVVPENCDNDDTVNRYQSVVGAIIFVQRPLPVSTLAYLVNIDVVEIREVLDNLQSVILLGSDDVPRIYHKSFPDYLMDQARCKDPRLRIDTRIHHTQIATRCFEIMARYLKRNILGLGDPARFMSNEDGLKEEGITDERLEEKIPQQLRYACLYWANHFEVANIGDDNLFNGLEKFVAEHMLYWLEVLSLIKKLNSAHRAIGVALKPQKSKSSDLLQLLSDALRFIGKFYELIERSALHTYYSALPFTPSDSLLYRRYIKDAVYNPCSIEGGPERWDALVATLNHGERVDIVKFCPENALFASCSLGKLKIWDAVTGTPISTIPGHRFAVANDFSTVASSENKTVTFYNVNGSPKGTMFTALLKIEKLALSSDSNRVAAALSDGTMCLWDSGNAELISCFDGSKYSWFGFSPTGTRLAVSRANGINLRDGISGKFIADLQCGLWHHMKFSGDGSRIASLSYGSGLMLWNSESGVLIGFVMNAAQHTTSGLAVSTDGSLLATTAWGKVTLWSGNSDCLAQLKVLQVHVDKEWPGWIAFSLNNILAIARYYDIKLYNVKTHTFIHTLSFGGMFVQSTALAFSPDFTCLAVGDYDGFVYLCDIGGIDPSGTPSKGNATAVTALTFSRDCSRLACGFEDGTVRLWDTNPTMQQIGPLTLRSKMKSAFSHILGQSRHMEFVRALGFDSDGRLFASGSNEGSHGTVKLWKGGDGTLRGTLKVPRGLQEVALSNSVLVVATWDPKHKLSDSSVTLWSLDTLSPIHTFNGGAFKVSIAEDSTLLAVVRYLCVELLDVVNHTTIATLDIPSNTKIHTMTFLPDNSQLVVQSDEGVFLSLNPTSKNIVKGPTVEHLIQLPNTPLWHGVPIWHCRDKWHSERHYFAALFPQHSSSVPMLWVPRDLHMTACTHGSSMIALGCGDGFGHTILVRLPPTSHGS